MLGANYPGSKWYKRSYELIQRHAPAGGAAAAEQLEGAEARPDGGRMLKAAVRSATWS